jgi:riboflavin kinase/FMN adenylyltransferase
VLVQALGARAVVVGDDFRFGRNRSGDVELLRRLGPGYGFEFETLGAVTLDGLRCSSTALRQALALPDLPLAERLLGHPYRMVGRVRRGLQLGRKLGMPTVNVVARYRPALAHGVYVVRAYWKEHPQGWPGVASLGVRPTLGLTPCLLETHLFDYSGSLYGAEFGVEICRFLRPQQRFDSLDALAAQMQQDGADARAYFAALK